MYYGNWGFYAFCKCGCITWQGFADQFFCPSICKRCGASNSEHHVHKARPIYKHWWSLDPHNFEKKI